MKKCTCCHNELSEPEIERFRKLCYECVLDTIADQKYDLAREDSLCRNESRRTS